MGAAPDVMEISRGAANGVVFGFPLVLMDVIRRVHPRAPNQFVQVPLRAGAVAPGFAEDDPSLVRFSAWIDLLQGPIILTAPDMDGRYFSICLIDARGEIIKTISPRSEGGGAHDVALIGPEWRGECFGVETAVRAPTNIVWVVAHVVAHGAVDRQAAVDLGRRLDLVPLGRTTTEAAETANVFRPLDSSPVQRVMRMSAASFFHRLALLCATPPLRPDEMETLAPLFSIGWQPGHLFDATALEPEVLAALEQGASAGMRMVWRASRAHGEVPDTHWRRSIDPPVEGERNHLLRAASAAAALGSPPDADILRFTAEQDCNDKLLSGANCYRIRFAEGALPPVEAYWSLSLGGERAPPPEAAMRRYVISDRNGLTMGRSGTLDVLLQSKPPIGGASEANWLPTPRGPFSVVMRLYWPKAAAMNGVWALPSIENIGRPEADHPLGARKASPAAHS